MQTALYIDDFLPHNLASLEDLAQHLQKIDRKRPMRRQMKRKSTMRDILGMSTNGFQKAAIRSPWQPVIIPGIVPRAGLGPKWLTPRRQDRRLRQRRLRREVLFSRPVWVLETGQPQLLKFGVADETAWDGAGFAAAGSRCSYSLSIQHSLIIEGRFAGKTDILPGKRCGWPTNLLVARF
jgi:hypothetical protein